MQLRQTQFTYSVCGKQKFKETGSSQNIYQKELDKACVQHDMGYRDFKDLTRRTTSNKTLRDNAFNIVKNPNMMGVKGVLFQGFINLLIKKFLIVLVKKEIWETSVLWT